MFRAIDIRKALLWRAYLSLVLAVLMLWPLIGYGGPGYIEDSSSYYRGGRAAVEYVTAGVTPGVDQAALARSGQAPAGAQPSAPISVQGLRSVPYSVLAYVFGAPNASMLVLITLQALATAALIAIFLAASVSRGDCRPWLLAAGVVAAGTGLPVIVTLATPDVATGLLIAGIALLAVMSDALMAVQRAFLAIVIACAISFHSSNIPIALGLLLVLVIFRVAALARPSLHRANLAWPGLATGLGLAIVLGVSLLGFGELSIAPKRYPFALARSIEDGPARSYLDRRCRTEHYAVCELFPNGMPTSVGDFLWAETGIEQRATPEQMERIRAEELIIVSRATAAYPVQQIWAVADNALRQTVMFAVDPADFRHMRIMPTGELAAVPRPARVPLYAALQWVALGAALAILAGRWRQLDARWRCVIALITVGILGNALVCGGISAPAARYGARVIWLLPLLAIASEFRWRETARAR